MILECAYSFKLSIFDTAFAGVVPTTHSTANSTRLRLRAIRLSGSPASMERTALVKYRATLSVILGESHSLWMTPVDNYSRPATISSSMILMLNAPHPEHWANHSLSVNSAPLVSPCIFRPSP